MGRLPHKRLPERDNATDRDIVRTALSRVDISWVANRVFATGEPATVLEPDRVADVFGGRSTIVPHPLTGRPHFVTASRPTNGAAPDDDAG
jgi:ABC-type cobalamin/Fe3+-siderophores transport system ATPase subunit